MIKPHHKLNSQLQNWLNSNTYRFQQFSNINELIALKELHNYKISLIIPTLNEEKTVGNEIKHLKDNFIDKKPLLDEIIVIDSNSNDNTIEISKKSGAKTYNALNISLTNENYIGKGENLWKSLYVSNGDIIIWLDGDITDITGRFVYGILGPLLKFDNIVYCKSFYDRPLTNSSHLLGGGRVTELLIRPLLNLFFKDLTLFFQPLSGEYAGRREILETLEFPIGYGVEISLLIDIYMKYSLNRIAQIDLTKRVHRNREITQLSRMAYEILQTFFYKLQQYNIINNNTLNTSDISSYIQLFNKNNNFKIDISKIENIIRPPINSIIDYKNKFNNS